MACRTYFFTEMTYLKFISKKTTKAEILNALLSLFVIFKAVIFSPQQNLGKHFRVIYFSFRKKAFLVKFW